jgi:hypothetical protein
MIRLALGVSEVSPVIFEASASEPATGRGADRADKEAVRQEEGDDYQQTAEGLLLGYSPVSSS